MVPKPPRHPKTLPSTKNRFPTPCSIQPLVRRFFYISKSDVNLMEHQIIYAYMFSDDEGNRVTQFPSIGPNGYVNLFINGILQEGNGYSVNVNALTIKGIGGTIYAGTPIIIEVVKFFIS